VEPQKDKLQNIPYDKNLVSWKKMLDNEGIIKANDIRKLPEDIYKTLEPQAIKAILVLPLYQEGKPFGFIGFDNTANNNIWEQEIVELLRTVAGVIANVYQRQKAQKALKEKVEEMGRLNDLMIGREMKMVELKKDIEKLKRKGQ